MKKELRRKMQFLLFFVKEVFNGVCASFSRVVSRTRTRLIYNV